MDIPFGWFLLFLVAAYFLMVLVSSIVRSLRERPRMLQRIGEAHREFLIDAVRSRPIEGLSIDTGTVLARVRQHIDSVDRRTHTDEWKVWPEQSPGWWRVAYTCSFGGPKFSASWYVRVAAEKVEPQDDLREVIARVRAEERGSGADGG